LALCTDCYTVGGAVNGSKWTAGMVRVVDTAATGQPLLVEDWLADQEVRLLDGILQYGFGNWHAVAEHMGGDKSEQSCEEHYEKFYLRQKTFPLPDLSNPPQKPEPPPAAPTDGGGRADADAAPKAKQERRGASGLLLDSSGCAPADLVGYMPLRGEYDTEYEHEAELQICEIEVTGAETADEREAKLVLLRAYNKTLDERQRRRDFVQRHEIIERAARHHALDRRLSREERCELTTRRTSTQAAPAHQPHQHTSCSRTQ
jgi:transcriptional adapter 2-alpha